jgi:NAD(P)-dependent dehydrogenase (short-subunit alcohol dehydrogenase family)
MIELIAVSKAATIHLAKSLAKACAPDVRVNSVSAGVMMTDWSKGFDEEHIQKVIQNNSLRKLVNVEEAAMLYGEYDNRGSSDLPLTDRIHWQQTSRFGGEWIDDRKSFRCRPHQR